MLDMKLSEYLDKHSLTNVAFAAKVGVDQSTIARLRKDDGQIPSPALMASIFEETQGQVRPDDFYGIAA